MGSKISEKVFDPKFRLKFHVSVLLIALIASVPICLIPALNSSVPLLVFISMLALVLAEFAAVEGVVTQVNQKKKDEES